jgi:ribonuclease P protein component
LLRAPQRLRKSQDFERLYRRGQFSRAPHMVLRSGQNRFENTRIGVVISKKVMKKAVARNRAKRRIVEQIRHFYNQLKPGYDCVVIVKQDIVELSPTALHDELIAAFSKAGIVQ